MGHEAHGAWGMDLGGASAMGGVEPAGGHEAHGAWTWVGHWPWGVWSLAGGMGSMEVGEGPQELTHQNRSDVPVRVPDSFKKYSC